MNYDIRNVLSDKKKLSIIAGVTVVGLTIGSVGLKVHHEKVNPSTAPVSANEIDSKDKIISQLRVENRKLKQQLNAQKTKNKSKSNSSSNELVPYNLNGRLGSLGGGYNSTPLSLGGDYNYTPIIDEPTVYEPIIEPVEDEIIEELDKPIVEPIVNEVVEPVERPQGGISEVVIEGDEAQLTGGTSEEIIEEDRSDVLDIINSATYKGKRIVFFVEKYLQCKPTYDYLEEDGKQILTVNGNGLFIRFEKVGVGYYDCTEITLNGEERKDLLNTIFELNEGESDNSVVISPDQPPVIEVPDPDYPSNKPVEEPNKPSDQPVESEDNKIDVNTDNNIGGTTPPAIAPPVTPPSPPQGVEIG